jgi:hypothetical protein
MSRQAVSALGLAAILSAAVAHAEQAEPPPKPAPLPVELRETLPGGSRLGDAPELPRARVDVLPPPTQIRIRVRRQAPPAEE